MCLAGMIKGSGVELYKLHILNRSLCTIHHSLAVAGSNNRVGSGLVYCAATSGTHQRNLAKVCVHLLGLRVKHVCAIAVDVRSASCYTCSKMMLCDNLHSKVVLLNVDVWASTHGSHQSTLNLGTRIVGVVQNTELRVAALTVQVELAVFLTVEVDTPFHKLFNLFGGIAHNLLNGTTVADKVAGNHSVLYMLVEIVNCKISY